MIDAAALNALFLQARTANAWLDQPVTDDELRQVFNLMRMGPTAANSQPARFVFVRSEDARKRLAPALSPGNLDKTLSAPAVIIVAHDLQFHEHMGKVFPHNPGARGWFDGEANRGARETSAFRNGTLQGAYFMLAARALGLDCGPMSGFDAVRLDAEFFPDGRFRSNFLINLGHADSAGTLARSPRFEFDEVCQVL